MFKPAVFYPLALVTTLAALVVADDPHTRNRIVGLEIGLAAIAAVLVVSSVLLHQASPPKEGSLAAKIFARVLNRWVLLAPSIPLVLMAMANAGGNHPWPGVTAVGGILAAGAIAAATVRHLHLTAASAR